MGSGHEPTHAGCGARRSYPPPGVDQEVNLLVTGSWDKTLKYWDTRQPSPALQVQLPERCYAVRHASAPGGGHCGAPHPGVQPVEPAGAVQAADESAEVSDPGGGGVPEQAGVPRRFHRGSGGGEPRGGEPAVQNFTFKCHREQTDIYSVNDIKFHPQHGMFVTCGSDGVFNFWDKDSKQRLKQMAEVQRAHSLRRVQPDGSPRTP